MATKKSNTEHKKQELKSQKKDINTKITKRKIMYDLKKEYILVPKNTFYMGISLLFLCIIGMLIYLYVPINSNNIIGVNTTNQANLDNNINTNLNSSDVVAIVNNEAISKEDYEKEVAIMLFSQGIPDSYKDQIPASKLLNQTIMLDLLYNQAVDNGFKVDRKSVENSIKTSLMYSGSNLNDFKKKLENKSFTYDDLMDFYAKQQAISSYLNASTYNKVVVSKEDELSYYQNNKDEFNVPKEISASHILVNTSKEATEIISKLDNGGNFSDLAKQYSIGPSASSGGDLGYFSSGMMVPEFENAAFNLTHIGEYTKEPVKTQFGYHIIELTGVHEGKTLSYDEVEDKINKELFEEKQKEEYDKLITNLLENANIQII